MSFHVIYFITSMLYLMVLTPYVTDSAQVFSTSRAKESLYVAQVPDHRVYVYKQWWTLEKILGVQI